MKKKKKMIDDNYPIPKNEIPPPPPNKFDDDEIDDLKERRDIKNIYQETQFKKELETLINKYNIENHSDTPDFILSDYLIRCLDVFAEVSKSKEKWYGGELNINIPTPVPMKKFDVVNEGMSPTNKKSEPISFDDFPVPDTLTESISESKKVKKTKISNKKDTSNPDTFIIAGNKIYDRCKKCNKMVRINKFIFGGLHICD